MSQMQWSIENDEDWVTAVYWGGLYEGYEVDVEVVVTPVEAYMTIEPADEEESVWPLIENPLGSTDIYSAIQETEQILHSLPDFVA